MNEKIQVIISANADRFKKACNDAKSALKDFTSKEKVFSADSKKAMEDAGSAVGDMAKTMGAALLGVGTALGALSIGTQDYNMSMAQLDTAFESAGHGANAAKDTFNEFYRLLGETDTATEASNLVAQLAKDESDLAEWTNIAAGAMARFPDSISTESLMEACNETAKTGEVTGALADALNWAGVDAENFQAKLDKCTTEEERAALMQDTLNGLYGEAGKKLREETDAIGDQREAQNKLMETMASLGEAIAPIVTAFIEFANDALQPVIDKITEIVSNHGESFKSTLESIGDAVGKAFNFFIDNWEIISSIAIVIAGIATAIGLYNVAMGIAAAVTTLMSSPLLIIVAVIGLIVGAIVAAIVHWDKIKEVVGKVVKSIKQFVSDAANAVKEKFNAIKQAISEKIEGAKQAVKEKFEAIKSAIKEKIDGAKQTVSNVFNTIKTTIGNVVKNAFTTVKTTFNNIKAAISTPINAAKTLVSNIFNTIKSKITSGVSGAFNSVKSKFDAIKERVSSVMDSVRDKVQSAIDRIKSIFNIKLKFPDIKMPHFNISGGKVPWGLGGKGTPPKIDIDWYARGGVFDSPTLFGYGGGSIGGLGEKGAEAIVPLEDHPKWIKALAKELIHQGGNRPIILQLDKKTLAEEVVDGINDLTRQRGSLPLRVM